MKIIYSIIVITISQENCRGLFKNIAKHSVIIVQSSTEETAVNVAGMWRWRRRAGGHSGRERTSGSSIEGLVKIQKLAISRNICDLYPGHPGQ